jgi:hypothetical protein
VLTLVNFVAALIVSWVVVYTIYGLTLLAVRAVCWTVRVVSSFIMHASRGVTLLLVYPVWWMVRAIAWLGEARTQSSQSDSIVAPAVPSTVGNCDVLTPTRRPTFPDVAVSIREASEALLEYRGRVFWARSEMGETAARTRNIIAQTRALIAEVDSSAAWTTERAAAERAAQCGLARLNSAR